MAKVIMSPMALSNLEDIHTYISSDSEIYADKMINRIIARISLLESHIRIGKIVREFNNPSIRELLEGNYRIIYEVLNENTVSVLRIYHASRLLKKL